MTWIESHQSLQRHRKTIESAATLGISRPLLIGHLHCLWWWGLDNADKDGLVGVVSDAVIAEAAEWPVRQARRFVEALTQAEFLDVDEDGRVRLHDWYDYAGKLNDRRKANAERQALRRAAHNPSIESRTSGPRTPDVRATSGPRTPATGPNLTGPNRTGPEEEPTTGKVESPPEAPEGSGKGSALRAAAAAADPSAEKIERFGATLADQPGWVASRAELEAIARYAAEHELDLEIEGHHIVHYLASGRGRGTPCDVGFVVRWLKREVGGRPGPARPGPVMNGATLPPRGSSRARHV